jgi:hypothetical protein
MDNKNVICIHHGILFRHKEEQNYVIFRRMARSEIIMFNEISWTQNDKYSMFLLICDTKVQRALFGKRKGTGWRGEVEK